MYGDLIETIGYIKNFRHKKTLIWTIVAGIAANFIFILRQILLDARAGSSDQAKSQIVCNASFSATEGKFTHSLSHWRTSEKYNFFPFHMGLQLKKSRCFNVQVIIRQTRNKHISLRFLPTRYYKTLFS